MEGSAYHETTEALEDTELAIIPRSEFEELLGSNPQVMKKFIGMLARNISEKEELLLAIAYNSLRKKVADTLVALHKKYNPQNDNTFVIDLSRENLAAIAGVAKESLIRMLGELKDEQLIAIDGSRIRILEYGRLEKCIIDTGYLADKNNRKASLSCTNSALSFAMSFSISI